MKGYCLSMGDVLKKFGRYFLLDQVAQGGMAEIYRARLATLEGAGRLIVIKRIQAGYGENVEFLNMFRSEIKVTMGFSHPNIVQLYDFGEEGGKPYIAMEFVDGKNLRQFISRFQELRQPFPVEMVSHVIEQAACGLHYAHSFKDKISGQPLNVVHRDISPQNILISYEGSVKVIDFGIAKATTNSEATRAGVIKGKPSYLSPEQISGESLDGRSDIFSLGIVLWELLCGKKLFAGENDLAVLKLIEACNTHIKPPSSVNPKVPRDLDYIVLKALAKNTDKRFQTAEEFQRALHRFLYEHFSGFNPSDLGYLSKDLFKNEIVEDRKKIQKLNDEAQRLLESSSILHEGIELSFSNTRTTSESATQVAERSLVGATGSGAREVFGDAVTESGRLEIERGPPVVPGVRPSASSAQRGVVSPKKSGSPAPPPQPLSLASKLPIPIRGSSRPSVPKQRKNSSQSRSSPNRGKILGAGIAAVLAIAIFGPDIGIRVPYLTQFFLGAMKTKIGKGERKDLGNQRLPLERTVTEPAVAQGKSVQLHLRLLPCGGNVQITVNGKAVDPDNPVAEVLLDAPLEIEARRAGFAPFRREFVLYSNSREIAGLKEYLTDIQMEPLRYGRLEIHSTPNADVAILIDGKICHLKTPVEIDKFPVGTYTIRLYNDLVGAEKTVVRTLQESRIVKVDEKLDLRD